MENIRKKQGEFLIDWAKTCKRTMDLYKHMYESTKITMEDGSLYLTPQIVVPSNQVKTWEAYLQELINEGIIKITKMRYKIISYSFTSMTWVERILSAAGE